MDDVAAIRKKKLAEMQEEYQTAIQQNINDSQSEEKRFQENIAAMESMIKPFFTKNALIRFGNIKTAHPEKATQVLMILAQALDAKKLGKINDSQLKELLKQMSTSKEMRIRRI